MACGMETAESLQEESNSTDSDTSVETDPVVMPEDSQEPPNDSGQPEAYVEPKVATQFQNDRLLRLLVCQFMTKPMGNHFMLIKWHCPQGWK